MKKSIFRYFLMMVLVIQMILGSSVMPFAAEGDEEDIIGNPEIVLVNGPVFDVTAGTQNEINIDIKNVSSYTAKSIVVQPIFTDVADNPFKISFDSNTNKHSIIAPRGEAKIKLLIDVDKTAASKTYAITLKYVYFNTKGVKATSTDTLYLKVKNTMSAPNFNIENYKVTPDVLQAGGAGTVGATIINEGPIDMYDVEVLLEGLDAKSISVSGINSKSFKKIAAGTRNNFGFNILASGDAATGNYPLSFKIKYKDDNGKAMEFIQAFFINVGGTSGGKKPTLEIRNMAEPTGVYGVNQNFSVKFDVFNNGEGIAKNIKISAAGMGEGGVVPKSSSIQTIKEMAPGTNNAVEFVFAATMASKSQNHPIEFTVEYEDGTSKEGVNNVVTFKQYAGANISNPEGDLTADEKKKVSKPKIIVSQYKCDPIIVLAGKEFDLTMTFLNTHKEKAVKNIKMFLTLTEEKSTDDVKTGNIFTPVDSSNTFYFDSIPSKSTVEKKLRLYVVPDAQPKTYTLTVNFEYEDGDGNEFTATELLGINVKQPTQIETGEIFVPDTVEAGMPVSVSFELYNTGKVTINNLMIKVEGDVEAQTKNTYLGNFESGYSEYYDNSFTPMTEGETPVSITISYDDPSGEHIDDVHEFVMKVMPPVPMDPMEGDPEGMGGKQPGQGMNWKMIGGISAAVIILLIIIVVFLKKRKAKKEAAFLEAEDKKDMEIPPINNIKEEKGNDANEQL